MIAPVTTWITKAPHASRGRTSAPMLVRWVLHFRWRCPVYASTNRIAAARFLPVADAIISGNPALDCPLVLRIHSRTYPRNSARPARSTCSRPRVVCQHSRSAVPVLPHAAQPSAMSLPHRPQHAHHRRGRRRRRPAPVPPAPLADDQPRADRAWPRCCTPAIPSLFTNTVGPATCCFRRVDGGGGGRLACGRPCGPDAGGGTGTTLEWLREGRAWAGSVRRIRREGTVGR